MSDFDSFDTDELAAELARRQNDANAAAATAARSSLASGAIGDVGAPDPHPMDLARQAIEDGLSKGRSRHEAVALGVAQVLNAALRGDTRTRYTGRTEPGA